MNIHSFFSRNFHTSSLRLAAIVLLALAWSSPAFCESLEKAIKKGDVEQVKAMLQADPSLVSKKSGLLGDTPLHIAAQDGQKEIAELLLANHAEVDAKDHLGFTPLMDAATWGHKDIVQLLLVHGADVNAKNKSGETPLWCANHGVKGAHTDVADVLRLFGAK
jgi:ankyrin repeat protein